MLRVCWLSTRACCEFLDVWPRDCMLQCRCVSTCQRELPYPTTEKSSLMLTTQHHGPCRNLNLVQCPETRTHPRHPKAGHLPVCFADEANSFFVFLGFQKSVEHGFGCLFVTRRKNETQPRPKEGV